MRIIPINLPVCGSRRVLSFLHSTHHQDVQALYRSHHGWLVSWLRRRIGCIDNANDLAQDTFVRVIDKAPTLAIVNEPRAFLSTIAHGLMVDSIRRREIERAYIEALGHMPHQEIISPEDRIIFVETLMRIDAMFDGLNPNVRSAFLLSRLEGMTYPEIARSLDVSLRTVETYMANALRHFLAQA